MRPAEEARRVGSHREMAAGGLGGELRAVGRIECFRVDGSCEWTRGCFFGVSATTTTTSATSSPRLAPGNTTGSSKAPFGGS